MKIRVGEHLHLWKNDSLGESAFDDHLIVSGHSFKEGSESLIDHEGSYIKRLALEQIEIIQHGSDEDVILLNRFLPDEDFIEIVYQFNHDA